MFRSVTETNLRNNETDSERQDKEVTVTRLDSVVQRKVQDENKEQNKNLRQTCSENLPAVYVTGGSGTRNKYEKEKQWGGMHWNKLRVRVVYNTQQDYTKSFTKMSSGRSSGKKNDKQ